MKPPVPAVDRPVTQADGKLTRYGYDLLKGITDNLSSSGPASATWGSITGTLSAQSDLQAGLDAKADLSHSHAISDVAGLSSSLAGKSPVGHPHAISDVTGLSSVLPKRGQVVVTISNNSLGHEQVVSAAGILPTDYVVISLAGHADADENAVDMIDLVAMAATPGTGQITVAMAFSAPTAGAIKLNWMA